MEPRKNKSGVEEPKNKRMDSYAAIAQELKNTGLSPAVIARAIQTFIRSGTVPLRLERYRWLISQAAVLMVGIEGMRNPATIVTTPMLLELMATRRDPARAKQGAAEGEGEAEKEVPIEEHLTERHPMAPRGSESTADRVNKELGFEEFQVNPERKTAGANKPTQRAKEMEVKLAVEWVKEKVSSGAGQSFAKEEELEQFIEDQVRKFYNMRAPVSEEG